jgi:opacity protein-like surface antigen
MFKKLLIASAVLAVSSSMAFANGAPYIGLSTGVIDNTASNLNYRGMPGTIFAGYGAAMGQGLYLGGEVFGSFGTAAISDNGLKSTYNYGISFIPGFMLSDHTMGYARLGLVRNRFTPKGNIPSTTVSGAQLGIGIQTSLTQNWDLRGEYTYTASRHIPNLSGDPRTDAATFGLVYKFD